MNIKKIFFLVLAAALCFQTQPAFAENKIRIVTTTNTIASITQKITGDLADIYPVAPPNRDIHFIVPTPKDLLKIKKADVFIHGGLDLEAWRGPLLDASGKKEFINGEHAVDVSEGVPLLEIPASLSRIHGDIHAFGNPHYATDPENAIIMASNITEKLKALYPGNASVFQTHFEAFKKEIGGKIKEWQERLAPYRGASAVVYHNSWPYFLRRFGLRETGFLEPKPGIPPTAKHLAELVSGMKNESTKIIIKEIFQENRTPKKLSEETGAKIVTLSAETQKNQDYAGMMEQNVRNLEEALK